MLEQVISMVSEYRGFENTKPPARTPVNLVSGTSQSDKREVKQLQEAVPSLTTNRHTLPSGNTQLHGLNNRGKIFRS